MIPRHLMQTWNSHDIPERWKAGPKSFRRHHPTWQYTLLSHHDRVALIEQHFPSLLHIFLTFPYVIQQADMIRYAYLYVYGGVYADLKTIFHKSLDELFTSNPTKDLFIVRNAQLPTRASNYFLASCPRHPFWLACLYDILQRQGKVPWWIWGKHCTVFYSCGPWLLERILDQAAFSRERILLPISFHQCSASSTAYISSLKGQSWNNWDSHCINWVFQNQEKLCLLVVLTFFVWSGIKRRTAMRSVVLTS